VYLRRQNFIGFYGVILALLALTSLAGGQVPAAEGDSTPAGANALRETAVDLARKGDYSNAIIRIEQCLSLDPRSVPARLDAIVILAWSGRAADATARFEALPADIKKTDYVIRAVAKSYRDIRKPVRAVELYRGLLERDPADCDARTGLAWARMDLKDTAGAFQILNEGTRRFPNHIELWLARTDMRWQIGDFINVLRDCDAILSRFPKHPEAVRAKARYLADLGAMGPADELAGSTLPGADADLRRYVTADAAAQRIRWGELDVASNLLERLIADETRPMERVRERCDRILTLEEMHASAQVTNRYAELAASKVEIPFWIHDAAASANLDLKHAEPASGLYQAALAGQPARFGTRMGLYWVAVEGERYDEAGARLDGLEKDTPEWVWDRGLLRYSWNHEDVTVGRGWWLAYQDRLAEAQEYFNKLFLRAPANPAVRSGMAQIEAWRGHSHAALEEFDTLLTMMDDDLLSRPAYVEQKGLSVRIGRAEALNACGLKEDARGEAAALLARNPWNTHAQKLVRDLELEDSTVLRIDVAATTEDPGVRETEVRMQVTQPILPQLAVYGLGFRRDTKGGGNPFLIQRVGAGADWDVAPPVTLVAESSRDVDLAGSEGILARLAWRAGDSWSGGISHNTYSLDVPLRARAAGVEGTQSDADLQWRYSDAFLVRAVGAVHDLDDGNRNTTYGLYGDAALFTRAHLKSRLLPEFSMGWNSETNVPYFSPDHDRTLAVTHRLDHIIARRYDRYFIHRLYTGIGFYDEAKYSPEFIWNVRYEHEYRFSAWSALQWGVEFRRRYYDGEPTDTTSWNLMYRKSF
jgi:biofilm PGA synthesis protein PgaA